MIQCNLQLFGGRGNAAVRNSVDTKLQIMNKEGEYRYHSTTVDNLESINRKGLQPSKRGQFGKGVYFSYNIEDSREWGKEQAKTNSPVVTMRVANTYLAKTDYEDIDQEQGLSPSVVPSSQLEIRQAGKWVSLSTFLKNRRKK